MEGFLIIFGILCFIAFLLLITIDSSKPKFYKLNEKAKKAEKMVRKKGTANIIRLKKAIKGAYLDKKIDGMEKEYLFQRIKIIEDLIVAQVGSSGPKYAAGDEMDKINPRN